MKTSTTSSRRSGSTDAARRLADMEPKAFAQALTRATPTQRGKLLRGRFRYDIEGFCRYCWPERFDLPFNALHASLFARQDCEPWDSGRGTVRDAVAAPRGYAKSTISSFALLVHSIVYGLEAYIVLLSAGQRLSYSLSRDLRNAFQDPTSRLAQLYGDFTVSGVVSEWEVSVRGAPSVGVLAASFGSEVRGAKHPTRGIRPTLVVIDDGEKKDRVRNPDQRKIWRDFLVKDVLKLGPRQGGTRYQVRGTILHPDAMLAGLMEDPGWKAERWRAIISWPERADLWARCKEIWADLTLGEHRRPAAVAFYESHRAEMDRGAEVLDPGAESIFQLYEQIWGEGLSSFLQEKQNDPVDPSAQIFFSERFARFRVVDGGPDGLALEVLGERPRRVRVKDLVRMSGRWDPSTGSAHGDYAAIAIVARDHLGHSYVLDCWMQRAKPSLQLAAAWTLSERWGLRRMVVESNGFQALVAEPYRRERADRRAAGKYWQLQLDHEPATTDKNLRIATMEPDVSNGWMLFNEAIPREVMGQFDQFPTAAHDDGPDVIQGAWADTGGTATKAAAK